MKEILLKDFIGFKYLSNIQAYQDGYAIVVSNANEDDNKYEKNIYLYKNNETRQLTSSNEDGSFIWYEDDILFSSLKNESDKEKAKEIGAYSAYYRISLNGGESTKLFDLPFNVTKIAYLGNDKFLFSAKVDYEYSNWEELSYDEKKKVYENRDSGYKMITELSWWSNGEGHTNRLRNTLYTFDLTTKKVSRVTDMYFSVSDFDVDKENNKAIYFGTIKEDIYNFDSKLYELDIDSLESTVLLDDKTSIAFAKYYKDGVILGKKDRLKHGLNENPKTFYLKDGVAQLVFDHDSGFSNSVGSDVRLGGLQSMKVVDDKFYFISTTRNSAKLFVYDGNDVSVLIDKEGAIEGFDIIDNKLYFVALHDMKLQEVYTLDLSNGEINCISSYNEEALKDKYVAKPELINFELDKMDVDGWVLKPINYDSSKTYPAILDIHGGPKTVYGEVYYHEMQYWASQGYFVFFCNPFGSDGRGNEFMDIRGKYGSIDYDQIMKFTDVVLSKFPIDKRRVGVTGGSYGGFMTNWIITHTDRFAAAATQRSISNWISMLGTSDIGTYFTEDQMGVSDLYGQFDDLMKFSPISYIKNAKTPTLIVHSEMDNRCWIPEGMQMFTALKYLGVPTRMIAFEGENHELSRSGKPKNRVKRLEEITDWLFKYTKDEQ